MTFRAIFLRRGSTTTNRCPFFTGLFAFAVLIASIAPAHADERVLYEKASAYNAIIVTEGKNGLRTLRFGKGGARQSVVKPGNPDHLALPYTRVALAGLALSAEPRRFLVVGLGGGTLPTFLRKHYPDAVIDAVEIDPEVVNVAKEFFGFREDALMKAHIGDGRQFIDRAERIYDVIFLDAFGANSIPAHLTTREFLHAVRRAVVRSGVVVSNLWGRGSNPLYDSMVLTYRAVFDELLILDVRGTDNKILLALPRKQPSVQNSLMHLARKISTAKRFPFDLGDPAMYGFESVHAKSRHERILLDRDTGKPKLGGL